MPVDDKKHASKLLGARIRRLREARGHTQDELAERAEVSTKHLGELERGRGNPSLRSIANISAVLGVSLCDLFDYELEGKDENALRKEIVQRLQSAEIDVLRVVYRALKP